MEESMSCRVWLSCNLSSPIDFSKAARSTDFPKTSFLREAIMPSFAASFPDKAPSRPSKEATNDTLLSTSDDLLSKSRLKAAKPRDNSPTDASMRWVNDEMSSFATEATEIELSLPLKEATSEEILANDADSAATSLLAELDANFNGAISAPTLADSFEKSALVAAEPSRPSTFPLRERVCLISSASSSRLSTARPSEEIPALKSEATFSISLFPGLLPILSSSPSTLEPSRSIKA